MAAGNDWLVGIPHSTGRTCAALALACALLQPLLLLTVDFSAGDLSPLLGGLHWQALLYSLWEQLTGIMIIIGLAWLFRERLSRQGTIAEAAAADTYTVYILHPLVLVPLAVGLRSLVLPPLLKFFVVSAFVIPLCFLIAHLIRAIPGVKRIL